jgi:hypothetical protein
MGSFGESIRLFRQKSGMRNRMRGEDSCKKWSTLEGICSTHPHVKSRNVVSCTMIRTSLSQFAVSVKTSPGILGPRLRVDGPASQSPRIDVSPFMKSKTRRWRTCRDFLGDARTLFTYSQFSRHVSRDVNRTGTVWKICEAAPLRKFRETSASWNTLWWSRQSQIRSTISTGRSLVDMFVSRARSIANSGMLQCEEACADARLSQVGRSWLLNTYRHRCCTLANPSLSRAPPEINIDFSRFPLVHSTRPATKSTERHSCSCRLVSSGIVSRRPRLPVRWGSGSSNTLVASTLVLTILNHE